MASKRHDNGFLELVDACRARIEEVSVSEVMEMQRSSEAFYLFDVREDREFAIDAVAHAIHLSKGVLERDIEKHVADQGARIILYCGGGYRSAIAAESLQRMGYMNVASMAGGIRAWRAAQGTVTKNT